jgi:hypothetical protein
MILERIAFALPTVLGFGNLYPNPTCVLLWSGRTTHVTDMLSGILGFIPVSAFTGWFMFTDTVHLWTCNGGVHRHASSIIFFDYANDTTNPQFLERNRLLGLSAGFLGL